MTPTPRLGPATGASLSRVRGRQFIDSSLSASTLFTMTDHGPDDPTAWMQWRFVDHRAKVGSVGTVSRQRYDFARDQAIRFAKEALPLRPISMHRPSSQVSLRTVLFTTDDQSVLIAVVGGHERRSDVGLVLPYALEHVGDRDLILVVPDGSEWPILARLPWIDHHTRVFTYDGGGMVERAIPLRSEVLEANVTLPSSTEFKLSSLHEGWLDEVISWADGHPRLQPSHRQTYLGWQVEGRLVLKVSRAAGGQLRIAAGVVPDSKSPNATGLSVVLNGPLLDPEPLREAVRQAVANRLRGDDTANGEHRFQARLQLLEPVDRLGLVTFIPEYPAGRPTPDGQGAGHMDFLGVDGEGRLHVVETKIGASESTVFLQALDYWVWVEANRPTLAAQLGANPDLPTALSVIVLPDADGPIVHRHNTHVADRLARSVPLRVWSAAFGIDGSISLAPVPLGRTRAGDRWPDRMRRRAAAASALDGVGAGTATDPIAGVYPRSEQAASRLQSDGKLHRFIDRAHSSQRFALDLFGSLDEHGVMGLLAPFFGAMRSAQLPQFEWTDPHDLLAERTNRRPFQTQVDVVLEGETIDDERVALLVEVKLTEEAFGGCSHADVAPIANRRVCSQSGPFGGDTELCWQLRNRDLGVRRRYDQVLQLGNDVEVSAGCWFRERNQPMRLAALAEALEVDGQFGRCIAALTVPSGHVSIRRRWAETIDMVTTSADHTSDEGPGVLAWLDPEAVLSVLDLDAQAFLIARYGLGPLRPILVPKAMREPLGWQLAAALVARNYGQIRLIESHPGGGQYDCLTLHDFGDRNLGGHIDINLEGSLHTWPEHRNGGSNRQVWESLAAGRVFETVWWCEHGMGWSGRDGDTEPWLAVMPRLAQRFLKRARWRNGVLDSELTCGRRDRLFDAIPAVGDACQPRPDDLPGDPSYRFWFLVDHGDRPLAAVDLSAAIGWNNAGRDFDLRADADSFVQIIV